jgi:hypothetical protein
LDVHVGFLGLANYGETEFSQCEVRLARGFSAGEFVRLQYAAG